MRPAVVLSFACVLTCSTDPTARYRGVGTPIEDAFVSAAASGDRAAVNAFLESGLSIDTRNQHGSTALMVAAGAGQTRLVEWLITGGADVHLSRNDGWNGRWSHFSEGTE
jgi:ankyrin repeat protein